MFRTAYSFQVIVVLLFYVIISEGFLINKNIQRQNVDKLINYGIVDRKYSYLTAVKENSVDSLSSFDDILGDDEPPVPVDIPFIGTVTWPRTAWKGVMLGICLIWATNFAIIKEIFAVLPDGVLDPSLYVAIRFTIAAIAMTAGAKGEWKNWELWKNGILVGLCVFTGYIGQSIGILASTANKTAFFCSLNVVWVALYNGVRTGKFESRKWIAVLMAITGAAFIELKGFVLPELTDLWLLLQPLGFGTGYIVLEESMKKFPNSASAFTSFKLLSVSIFCLGWAASNGHTFSDVIPIMSNPIAAGGILYTSLITTALAIWLQSITFKNVSSTDASIILTSEPIWAASFATVLIGEKLSREDYIGGALIILGCLYNEVDFVAKIKEYMAKKNSN